MLLIYWCKDITFLLIKQISYLQLVFLIKLCIFISMRYKLNKEDKKVSVTVTISPVIMNVVNELYGNKSKYIEKLMYKDLLKNNKINKDTAI